MESSGRDGKVELTEELLAGRFIDQRQHDLRFDYTSGYWMMWDGTSWVRDETRQTLDDLRRFIKAEVANSKPSRQLGSSSFVSGVEKLAKADKRISVTSACWDTDPMLLGTPDGTVDLRTGVLRKADPKDKITKLTAVGPAVTADCPRWLAFLLEATGGDRELVAALQRLCGYWLTGSTEEQKLAFLYGPGGNGKSVFTNTVANILAKYARSASMDTFMVSKYASHTTDLARLDGARLVTASETEEGQAFAAAKIKQLTGGEIIAARFMRQDNFEFKPQFKLLFSGNHAPQLVRVDDAMRRRLLIIPFMHKPAVPDHQLEEKLRAEGPGILRWMIDGCLEWKKGGLRPPPSVSSATQDYFDQEDVLEQWLDDCCDRDHPEAFFPVVAAFASWKSFAEAAGHSPGDQRDFSAAMLEKGFEKKTRKETKSWMGLALRDGAQ